MMISTTTFKGAGVYVIGPIGNAQGNWKIGVTKDICRRFKTIQAHSPIELEVKAFEQNSTRERELEIHRCFKSARIQGEWFELTDFEKHHLITMLNKNEKFGAIADKKAWDNIPQRTPGANYILGRCSLCGRNVQSKSPFFKEDVGVYRHADCKTAIQKMKRKKNKKYRPARR